MEPLASLLITPEGYGRLRFLTRRLTLLCCLLLVGAALAPMAHADPGTAAAAPGARKFASFYRDARVFRDRNRNGVLDAGERYTVTDADGRFDPPKGKGRLRLSGGTRIDTGEINTLTLTAPSKARVISVLTSLWQALLEKRQSQTRIRKLLGLARNTKALDFRIPSLDDFESSSAKKKKLIKAEAQYDTLLQFIQALSLGAPGLRTVQPAMAGAPRELEVMDAAAQALIALRPKKPLDLTDQATNQTVYATAFSRLGTALDAGELENVAAGSARLNQLIARDQSGNALNMRACILTLLPETGFDVAFNHCFMPPPAPVVAAALPSMSRNATPTLSGTADARIVKVQVYRNGALVGTVPAVNGAWSYTSPPLPDGRYLFEIKGFNSTGVEGIPSPAMPTEIRTVPPDTPTVTPQTARSFTPTLTGNWSGAAGDTLAVTVNGKTYASAPALTTSGSAWFLTVPAGDALPRGTYDVLARDTDAAGNSSVDATTRELTISIPFKALEMVAGGVQSCAILEDGSVKCWGANCDAYYGGPGCLPSGQLGLGDRLDRGARPGEMGNDLPKVNLGTGRTAKALAIASSHVCVLLDDGSVKCWGDNSSGQLGLGDTESRGDDPGEMGDALPRVDLGTGRTVKTLAAGYHHTCAILDDDSVKCWGSNAFGALGLGDTESRGGKPGEMGDALPRVDLGSGRTAKALAAGFHHTCAILDDGSVKCWGDNALGELGLGDTEVRGDEPGEMGDALQTVNLGTGLKAAALTASSTHTCALLEPVIRRQGIKCWGDNFYGQLGLGDTIDRGSQPDQMGDQLPPSGIKEPFGLPASSTQVAAGGGHTCALFSEFFQISRFPGGVICWGDNHSGQLGLGSSENQLSASYENVIDPGQGRRIVRISSGGGHTCALLDDGTIKCWGANYYGQLGLGDTFFRGDVGGRKSIADLPVIDLGG